MTGSPDTLVVGGGVVGLSHALAAARAGRRVTVVDRDPSARGASVRNFGMIWPIGQPTGEGLDLANRSRELWLRIGERAGFAVRPCGSLHLARAEDERRVLEEFIGREGSARAVRWLDAEETRACCPAVRADGLIGSMHSPRELGLDPREAIPGFRGWLEREFGVRFIVAAATGLLDAGIVLADGSRIHADRVLLCSGAEVRLLASDRLAAAPLERCRLQMMRTGPQPDGWSLGPHIAGGLTLCHYESFGPCPSLPALRARLDRQLPEHRRHGVHVLAAQSGRGEVVIGDSHHSGRDAESVGIDAAVNGLILRTLDEMLDLPDRAPAELWTGVYARCTDGRRAFIEPVGDRCLIVTGLGGAGMTLSPALGERTIASLG